MERDTLIAGGGVAVAAAALILAIVAKSSVASMSSKVNFDTSVKVATVSEVATDEAASEATTEAESAEGSTEASAAEATTDTSASSYEGRMNIILQDGVIKITDSVIKVPAPDSSEDTDVHNLYVYLSGTNALTYDSTTNYLVLNDSTIIRTINAVDAVYDGISQFMNENGETVLIGEKAIDDTTAIAVVHTVPVAGDDLEVNLASETQTVQDILNNTYKNVAITEATLFGYSINPEWVEDMVIADQGLELIKGDEIIYATPYIGTFASGTTNNVTVGNLGLTYSTAIKDSSTGYTPYILNFSEEQDGSVKNSNNALQAKVLAQSNLQIKDLFTTN